jgi:hypothetical protein
LLLESCFEKIVVEYNSKKVLPDCKLPQIRTVYLYKLHDKTNNLIAW